ncbi:MAG: DMT family transporter [Gammaproteobacteria bacterium]
MRRLLPYLLLLVAVLSWSGNMVIGRGVHESVPPIALSFWRWLVAFLILLPFALRTAWQEWHLVIRHWRFLFVQGVLGVTGYNTLVYLGLQTTTAINAAVVSATIPVIIVFISFLVYQERIARRQALGGLISFFGVIWIISHGSPADLFGLHANRGDLWILAAALTWASYSVFLRHYPEQLHPLVFLLCIMAAGLLVLAPFYAWEHLGGRTIRFDTTTVITVLYVALFASVIAFICWNRAVRWVGANRAGIFVHFMPVFSTLLAILFLGERLYAYHLVGIAAVATGITLTTWHAPPKKATVSAEEQG